MRDFIEAVLGDMRGNAVLAVANAKERTATGKLIVSNPTWFKYPDDIDKMVAYAEKKRSGDARNVYIAPDLYGDMTNGDGELTRSKKNALLTQTIHLDSDSCPPDAYRIPPSIHVQTSKTHGHDYWILNEPVTSEEASELALKMVTAHRDQGADPSAWSANKYLRLPTVNTTYDPDKPFKIDWHHTGEVYDFTDLAGAYQDIEVDINVGTQGARGLLTMPENVPQPEDLPDYMELLQKIPDTERRLNDLILKVPKDGADGWRSEQRYALLLDLQRFGFSVEETVSIAWHCPAASKWRTDQRGVHGLWAETEKALREIEFERGTSDAGMPESLPDERAKDIKVKLLTKTERAEFAERYDWTIEYREAARQKVQVFNGPYHDVNAWTCLSIAFSDVAYIPKLGDPMYLNLYSTTLGPSSSGKTEATRIMWWFINAMFPYDSPDIGANHSETSLMEVLLERDGKVSFLNSDEADGLIASWRSQGWTTGIQSAITKIYDGPVPMIGRSGKKELRKSGVTSRAIQHLMGTMAGMLDVLDPHMFKTGYLARQIWAIGEDIPETEESVKTKQATGDIKTEYEALPKYWANSFHRMRSRMLAELPEGEKQIKVILTDEAAARFDKAKWAMVQMFRDYGDPEIYRTAIRRMNDIIWKASALIALSEGSRFIATRHMVTALGYAEGWLEALIYVEQNIANSAFSKACDEIERYIAAREGKEVEASRVYALRKSEPIRIVDEYIQSLMKQRRIIERPTDAGGARFYKIREEKKK